MAPTCRCASAAARRNTSGRTRPNSPSTRRTHADAGEVSSYWTDRALDFITTQPGAWLKLIGRKFALLWNATEMLDTESQESYAEWSWPLRLLGWFGHFGVLVPLGAVRRHRRRGPTPSRLAILYVHGRSPTPRASLLFYVFARYRLPLVPLLMLFAAARSRRRHAPRRYRLRQRRLHARARTHARSPRWSSSRQSMLHQLAAAVSGADEGDHRNQPRHGAAGSGRLDEAMTHYPPRDRHSSPTTRRPTTTWASCCAPSGQIDEAIATYQRALAITARLSRRALQPRQRAARQASRARRPNTSGSRCSRFPESAGARNNLGHRADGRRQGATSDRARFARPWPPIRRRRRRTATSPMRSAGADSADEAIAEYRRAIAARSRATPATHYNLGQRAARGATGSTKRSPNSGRRCRLTPASPEAHNNLGIALGSKGQHRRARSTNSGRRSRSSRTSRTRSGTSRSRSRSEDADDVRRMRRRPAAVISTTLSP